TACLAPVKATRSASKRSTNLPTEETKVESRHSLRYSHSLPQKLGSCSTTGPTPTTARMALATCSAMVVGVLTALIDYKYLPCNRTGCRVVRTILRFRPDRA